jgi:hypothetical protein
MPPVTVPRDLEMRAALYRTLLAQWRMLIILDNAATVGQVRPLLPGTDACLVLVRWGKNAEPEHFADVRGAVWDDLRHGGCPAAVVSPMGTGSDRRRRGDSGGGLRIVDESCDGPGAAGLA